MKRSVVVILTLSFSLFFLFSCGGGGGGPTGEPPTVSLAADPTEGNAPLSVVFEASATDPDGDEIVEYFFDFGDGSSHSFDTSEVIHTYQQPGNYVAKVRVRDSSGAWSHWSAPVNIAVREGSPPKIEVLAVPETSLGFPNKELLFHYLVIRHDESAHMSGPAEFDFGDGSVEKFESYEWPLYHVYEQPGEYLVRVRVKLTDGTWTPWSPPVQVTILEPGESECWAVLLKGGWGYSWDRGVIGGALTPNGDLLCEADLIPYNSTPSFVLYKVSHESGSIKKKVEEKGNTGANALAVAHDGSVYAVIYKKSENRYYLTKFDSELNFVWETHVTHPSLHLELRPSGSVILCRETSTNGDPDDCRALWVAEYAPGGSLLWEDIIPVSFDIAVVWDFIVKDNYLYGVAHAYDGNVFRSLIFKINLSTHRLEKKLFTETADSLYAITTDPAGELIKDENLFAYEYETLGVVATYDENLNLLRQIYVPEYSFYSVTTAPDGKVIAGGRRCGKGEDGYEMNVATLVCLDPSLSGVLWERNYSFFKVEFVFTDEEGYIYAGIEGDSGYFFTPQGESLSKFESCDLTLLLKLKPDGTY